MEKDGFLFTAASRIDALMYKFESDILGKYTPCNLVNVDGLAYALGVVHIELILIHLFREGNGRLARLLADLMCMQSNRPSLSYSYIKQTNCKGFQSYIEAVHAVVECNYQPIQKIFMRLLSSTGDS